MVNQHFILTVMSEIEDGLMSPYMRIVRMSLGISSESTGLLK